MDRVFYAAHDGSPNNRENRSKTRTPCDAENWSLVLTPQIRRSQRAAHLDGIPHFQVAIHITAYPAIRNEPHMKFELLPTAKAGQRIGPRAIRCELKLHVLAG